MDSDLIPLLGQSVGWGQKTGEDSFGNNVYAADVSKKCRIDSIERHLGSGVSSGGLVDTTIAYTVTLITEPWSPLPAVGDRFTMPDGMLVYTTSVNTMYAETATPDHCTITATTGDEV